MGKRQDHFIAVAMICIAGFFVILDTLNLFSASTSRIFSWVAFLFIGGALVWDQRRLVSMGARSPISSLLGIVVIVLALIQLVRAIFFG